MFLVICAHPFNLALVLCTHSHFYINCISDINVLSGHKIKSLARLKVNDLGNIIVGLIFRFDFCNRYHYGNIRNNLTCELVVGIVVDFIVCENNICLAISHQIYEICSYRLILIEHFIIIVKTYIFSTDMRCSTTCLFLSYLRNLLHRERCRADISVRGSSSKDLVSCFRIFCKRTAAAKLNVIRMRTYS